MASEMTTPLTIIILAAGKGSRLQGDTPKAFVPLAHKPLLHHVLETAKALNPTHIITVVNERMVADYPSLLDTIAVCVQEPQDGTGGAVKVAFNQHPSYFPREGMTLVLYADTPFVPQADIAALYDRLRTHPDYAAGVMSFLCPHDHRYGTLQCDASDHVQRIIEYRHASPEQRALPYCNAGIMVVRNTILHDALPALVLHDSKEYYLVDLIEWIATHTPFMTIHQPGMMRDLLGINTPSELAEAEALIQTRLRAHWLEKGVQMMDPTSVYLASDTIIGAGTRIEPHVYIGPGTHIGADCRIRAFSYIEGATIARGATIGPFARIRPGTHIGEDCRIGNFVEIKNAQLSAKVSVNHLSYIGDATIGGHSNIGAGTITCNYDGHAKHPTVIGAHAFIGSNTALVAPITLGDNVRVGAGSVLTKDVPGNSLAVARAEQRHIVRK